MPIAPVTTARRAGMSAKSEMVSGTAPTKASKAKMLGVLCPIVLFYGVVIYVCRSKWRSNLRLLIGVFFGDPPPSRDISSPLERSVCPVVGDQCLLEGSGLVIPWKKECQYISPRMDRHRQLAEGKFAANLLLEKSAQFYL